MKFQPGDKVRIPNWGNGTVLCYTTGQNSVVHVGFDGGRSSYFFERHLTLIEGVSPLIIQVRAYVTKELAR